MKGSPMSASQIRSLRNPVGLDAIPYPPSLTIARQLIDADDHYEVAGTPLTRSARDLPLIRLHGRDFVDGTDLVIGGLLTHLLALAEMTRAPADAVLAE